MVTIGIPKLAGITALSSSTCAPEYAPEQDPCVEGVEIEKTNYCTDRFGVIFERSGEEVLNPRVLRRVQRKKVYGEAKEAAQALYRQQEAARRRAAAAVESPLEEMVEEAPAVPAGPVEEIAPQRGPPPPYLRPSAQEETRDPQPQYLRPSRSYSSESFQPQSPSYTNVDPEKKEDKKGGYKMWCILTGLFAVGGGATLGVMVSQESANTEDLAALGAIAGISTLVALPLCGYAYSK